MNANDYLNSDKCPNIKEGFELDDIQISIIASIMDSYAKEYHQNKVNNGV
tara:strand:- start:4303 stop:4452 length:150 start_codon:yes stop_codon:yes gene_type:complete